MQLHGSRGQRPELRYWIPNQSMGGVRDWSVSCISDTALLAQGWLYRLQTRLISKYRRGRSDLIGASVTQSTPGEILAVLASSVLPGPVLRRTVLRPTVLRPSVLFPFEPLLYIRFETVTILPPILLESTAATHQLRR